MWSLVHLVLLYLMQLFVKWPTWLALPQNASMSTSEWAFSVRYWSWCVLVWHTKLVIWHFFEWLLVTVPLSELNLGLNFIAKYCGVTGADSGWCPNELAQIHRSHRKKANPPLTLSGCSVRNPPDTIKHGVLWGVVTRPFLTYLSHGNNLWDSFWWGVRIYVLPSTSQYSCTLCKWWATACDQLLDNRVPTSHVPLSTVSFRFDVVL